MATTTAVMQLVAEGRLELDAPVAKVLPHFGERDKERVTVRHLLTHSSGLHPWRGFHETLLERGYGSVGPGGGPPDSRSVFPIGSISKQFTAAAIVALADQGKLRLDAPVGDYLPEWFAGERELRVRHLLTNTTRTSRRSR